MYHQISDNIYLISKENTKSIIHCNAYLIVNKDEAILIGPGNIADFEDVYKKT